MQKNYFYYTKKFFEMPSGYSLYSFCRYTTFGSPMSNRSFNANSSRYGFNGKEKDDENNVNGGSYDFGARMLDSRLGKFLSLDPLSTTYTSISPYCYAANSPLRFTDIDGKGPGDKIIIFTGALLIPTQSLPETMDKLKSSVGVNGADVKFYKSHFNVINSIMIINSAIKEIESARAANPNATVIIFGYSFGGVLAQGLADELKRRNIKVDLLVTLDAALGPKSAELPREITSNVVVNKNYYQSNKPNEGAIQKALDSNGGENQAEDCNKTDVQNFDMTKTTYEGKPVDHYNIDDKLINTIIKDINAAEPVGKPQEKKATPALRAVPTGNNKSF